MLLLSGFLRFAVDPGSPWGEMLAAMFGVGAGLTLDEFALWVRLDDVYWSQEGRTSLDAVVVATLIASLVVLGVAPFDTSDATPSESLLLLVTADAALCLLVIVKGRPLMALIGAFVPLVSLVRRATAGLADVAVGPPALQARQQEAHPLRGPLRTYESPPPACARRDRRTAVRGSCGAGDRWV